MPDRYTEKKALLPSSYVEFMETFNGWEGDLGEVLGYIALWDRESIHERWIDYEMAQNLNDRWFSFGSNGGGEMLCFDLASGGDRIFWIPFVGMSGEEAILRSHTFKTIADRIGEIHGS
ncbi:MAG: hypothetical protein ABS79_03250 [Planctomycetes bacterium SCN 63-9]|nr:MAG: hypothetical protein ABS79_03250 [Planctomycetes bacterium SCN 63-9]